MLANLSRAAIVAGAIAATARAIGTAFAGAAEAAGRFTLNQAMFHQNSMTSLRATLHGQAGGGQAAATSEFRRSLQLAALLPGDNNEFVASRRQLATTFQDSRERDAVFALQEDLAALNMDNASTIRASLTNVLGQIRGQDRVLGNDLIQLQTAGLGRTAIFDAIARGRNLQGTDAAKRNQARELLSNGQVKGDEAIRAMISSVEARTGQRIGGLARAQGNSLAGLMSNLESAPATLMQNLMLERGGPEGMAGFQALTGSLRELNEILDPASRRGARFMAQMERLINGVLGALFQRGDATSLIDTLLDTLDQLVPMIVSVTKGLRSFLAPAFGVVLAMMLPLIDVFKNSGNVTGFQTLLANTGKLAGALVGVLVWVTAMLALGTVVIAGGLSGIVSSIGSAFQWLGNAIVSAWNSIRGYFSTFGADGEFVGRSIVEGIATGIRTGASAAVDAVRVVGRSVIDAATGLFDIHSPSRVMARLGGFVSEGFAVGIRDGAPGAASALDGLLGGVGAPRMTAGALGASGGAGGVAVGEVSVTVMVPSGTTDPEAVGEAVGRLLPGALAEALRQLAIERGARV